jgi:hypothetical protein
MLCLRYKSDHVRMNESYLQHIQEAGATWFGLCTVLGVPAALESIRKQLVRAADPEYSK